MKFSRVILFGMCLAVAPVAVVAQTHKSEFELMQSIVANPDNTPRPVFPFRVVVNCCGTKQSFMPSSTMA